MGQRILRSLVSLAGVVVVTWTGYSLVPVNATTIGPLHGYGVQLRIQQISGHQLEILQGSLYPALYRLEHNGLIASEWGESGNKGRAKYYRLTAVGRRQLKEQVSKWNRTAEMMAGIINATPEEL